MNKLLSLVRASMTDGMRIFTYRAKDEKSQKIMPLVLAGLMCVLMFISANSLAEDLAESGAEYVVLVIFTIFTTMLTVMEGIYKSGSLLFKCRDNDLLMAMPIKRTSIVLVRIFKFYVFEIMYNALFMGPAILAYALNAEIQPSFLLVAVLLLLLLPMIPVAVSCFIGALTAKIATRFRRNVLLQVILSFVFMILIIGLGFFLFSTPSDGHTSLIELSENITRYYYPADAVMRLATDFHFLELLLFVVINVGVFGVTVLIIAKFYFKIITKINEGGRRRSTNNLDYHFKKHNPIVALIKKELTRYFSTPTLILNTALGLVLFLLAVGAICLKFDDVAATLTGGEEPMLTLQQIRDYIPGILFVMVAFTSLMTYITATAFSLEGKTFNILKTLPVDGRKVIMAKVLTAVLLTSPALVVGCLVMYVRFQFGLVELLLILAATVVLPLVTEIIGIFIDFKYARFNAENDAETVKQSPGVMVMSFLGLGMTIMTVSFTFILVMAIGQVQGMLIIDILYMVILLILVGVVKNFGEQKYLKLVAD